MQFFNKVKLSIVKLPLQVPWHSAKKIVFRLAAGFLLKKMTLTWISSLSPHLIRFVMLFARRPYFRFRGSLITSFVIGEMESKGTNVTVSFSNQSL